MPASQPLKVLEVSSGLGAGNAPGTKGVPNKILRYSPKRAVTSRTKSVLRSPPREVLPISTETRSRRTHADAEKAPHAAFFLQTN